MYLDKVYYIICDIFEYNIIYNKISFKIHPLLELIESHNVIHTHNTLYIVHTMHSPLVCKSKVTVEGKKKLHLMLNNEKKKLDRNQTTPWGWFSSIIKQICYCID